MSGKVRYLIWAVVIASIGSAKVLAQDAQDDSPVVKLHYAAFQGDVRTIERLLKQNPSLVNAMHQGRTLLHAMVSRNDYEMIQTALRAGADVNARDKNDKPPLYWAMVMTTKDIHVAKMLLSAGADVNAKIGSSETLLHWAAGHDRTKWIRLLITNKANLQAKDEKGRTPLQLAIERSYENAASVLLDEGAELDVFSAAALGKKDGLRKLLVKKPDLVRATDYQSGTALHWAARKGQKETAEILLDYGADINARDKDKMAPLHHAIMRYGLGGQNRHRLMIQYLLGKGPKLDVFSAAALGKTDMVVATIKAQPALLKTTLGGKTPLYWSVYDGAEGTAKALIELGADVNAKERRYGLTVLRLAGYRGDSDIVKLLLSHGAKVNARSESRTALFEAARRGHVATVELLLKSGAHANAKDKSGFTPLIEAVYHGHVDVVRLLIKHGAEINHPARYLKRTALHRAAAFGHLKICQLLIAAGADVDAEDRHGLTPLNFAADKGADEIVKLLLLKKAGVDVDKQEWLGSLCIAVASGHKSIVKILLDSGGEINTKNVRGRTVMHIAAGAGHKDLLGLLLDRGANIECIDRKGQTPLHMTARKGRLEAARFLVARGAKLEVKDLLGRTPSEVALLCGHTELSQFLKPQENGK